ncbi:AVAST type 3 anti-phage proein Avs3b [Burkholderia pseudomallei]|nr:AVAST type 3 anti-phage proein Avs3b [Burkholderia pseudomallei]
MTMNESKQLLRSISSEKTENCGASDNTLELGRKLVNELGLDQSVDTLGRWMAHYIADLVTKAETAAACAEKSVAERECFNAILALWKHRSELPDGHRPFQALEPVMRAIESLDPENNTPRYFRAARPPKGEAAETSEQERWLTLADELDYSAKVLIGYCLVEAAEASLDESKEWVKLATAIEDDGVPEIVVRVVSTAADMMKEPDLNEATRSLLKDKIRRLHGFLEMTESLVNTLEEHLQAQTSANEDPSNG